MGEYRKRGNNRGPKMVSNMLTDLLLVFLGAALTVGTALFVAAEFSLVALDPGTLDHNTISADRRGAQVLAGVKELSTQLSGAQLGITVTTILLGYTTQPAVGRLLTGLFDNWAGEAAAVAISAVVALILVNGFSMLFGELVPKNVAITAPLATARIVVPVQRAVTAVFRPLITVSNSAANGILRTVGVEPREELSGSRSATELAALVRRSAEQGTLDAGTAILLKNSLEFEELTAVDVMTDRTRMHTVEVGTFASEVIELARTTGHSRFPVIDGSIDDVVGLIHLRQLVQVPYERRGRVPAAALMVEVTRVPETVHLGSLLADLRAGQQLAVVVDEYGGTSGVVTLEDVLEELVGEVSDEHDRSRWPVVRRPDGSWLCQGVLRPDELQERTGLCVPDDGPYETLAGLVMAELGRLPEIGDEIQVGDVQIAVQQMRGRRVETLRVWQVQA